MTINQIIHDRVKDPEVSEEVLKHYQGKNSSNVKKVGLYQSIITIAHPYLGTSTCGGIQYDKRSPNMQGGQRSYL